MIKKVATQNKSFLLAEIAENPVGGCFLKRKKFTWTCCQTIKSCLVRVILFWNFGSNQIAALSGFYGLWCRQEGGGLQENH